MIIDEISLTCDGVTKCLPDKSTPEYGLKFTAATIFSVPLSQMGGIKNAYLFAEDLWLYHYDVVEHEGLLGLVFNVTSAIQGMKFLILDDILHW